jgi:hypothetical protein
VNWTVLAAIAGLILLVVTVRFGLRWFAYAVAGWSVFIMWWLVIWLSPPLLAWVELVAPFAYVGYRIFRGRIRRWLDHGPKRPPFRAIRRWPRFIPVFFLRRRIRRLDHSPERVSARRLRRRPMGVARALGGKLKIRRWEKMADGNIRLAVTIRAAGETFRALSPVERQKREAEYAAMVGGRDVSISPDLERADRGYLTIHRYPPEPEPDYTGTLGAWPGWPGADDFSKPIPIGVAVKTGEPVGLRLFAGGMRNILIFGVPGSGKSVGAAEIIATAAQDRTVDLWGLDGGGGTDMEFWRHRMSHYEVKIERAFLMVQELKAEIDRRSEAMVAARRRVIDPHDSKILLVMEEFATFTDEKRKRCIATGIVRSGKEDDPSESFADALAYVGRLGRKYGVGIVLITQVPTVKTIPSQLRGLVQYAWGFRCRDRGGWQAGFGGGVPFVRLDKSRPGTSMLLADNDDPLLMRSYFISDEELEEIAAATSLAPVDSLAPDTDTFSADLCLGIGENGAAPSEIAAAPIAAPYVPDAWDLAVLAEAGMPGKTGAELINLVGGLSAGAARKRLKILTGAGYLSAPARPKVTDPQLYVTTLTGREAIKAESQG